MAKKPKFFQATLVEVKGNVFDHAFPNLAGTKYQCTMEERMGSKEAKCTECGENVWILLPVEGSAVREGGKRYIECLNCGYTTHL
jgi:hypothetical protein